MPIEFEQPHESDRLIEARAFSQSVDREPRDVPDPVIYDDEYGKTIVTFPLLGSVDGVRMFDVVYKHQEQKPKRLSQYIAPQSGFFFHWNQGCRFSVGSTDGTPVIFVDTELLRQGRKYLTAVLHEIGHTYQQPVDSNLWRILRADATDKTTQELWQRYPHFRNHIRDLVLTHRYCRGDRKALDKISHRKTNGVDVKGLSGTLLQEAVFYQELTPADAPIGPTHTYIPFFGRIIEHKYPGLYLILDAMGEELAWRQGLELQKKAQLECGLRGKHQWTEAMIEPLDTYNDHYKTDAYTLWLEKDI